MEAQLESLLGKEVSSIMQTGLTNVIHKYGAKVQDQVINRGTGGVIGMNWGQGHTSVDCPPEIVVARLKELGIQRVRLYSTLNPSTEKALANSGIQVTVTMWPDAHLADRTPSGAAGPPYKGQPFAEKWVHDHVLAPASRGCAVNMVLVGNEPSWSKPYDNAMLPALANLHDALIKMNLKGHIRTGVPLSGGVIANSWPPSSAVFAPKVAHQVSTLCKHLRNLGSPFVIHLYPYFAAATAHSSRKLGPMEYYFFQPGNKSEFVDPKSHLKYYNSLDASIDSVHYALEKIGYSDLEVIVGETGWPTSGAPLATKAYAEKYNQALIAHLKKGGGTPKKPGKALETILFEVCDSDKKAGIEAHWGVHAYEPSKKCLVSKLDIPACS